MVAVVIVVVDVLLSQVRQVRLVTQALLDQQDLGGCQVQPETLVIPVPRGQQDQRILIPKVLQDKMALLEGLAGRDCRVGIIFTTALTLLGST